MINCLKCRCAYSHCCIECDAQKSKGGQCGCNMTEDCMNRDGILKICPYAEKSQNHNSAKEKDNVSY